MARVQTSSVAANIDWKGDGYALDNSLANQDVNFDGTVTGGSRVLGGSTTGRAFVSIQVVQM